MEMKMHIVMERERGKRIKEKKEKEEGKKNGIEVGKEEEEEMSEKKAMEGLACPAAVLSCLPGFPLS